MPYTQQDLSRVFDGAIALIEQGWCQWADARGFEGIPCDHTSDQAEEWSITGAFERAAIDLGFHETCWFAGEKCHIIDRPLWKLVQHILVPLVGNIDEYNNSYMRTQDQVWRMLRRARESIPQLGLEQDERLCALCSEPIPLDYHPDENICPHCI